MCRWLAYVGAPIPLCDLLTQPDHSLIDQSRCARESVETTNGDGFGIGWYGAEKEPATFHDTHPAWNNTNLEHLADHVRSRLFLSHVRASSGTPIQETNCHPFAFERWLFQHNGTLPEFGKLKRQLQFDVDQELFPHIRGSSDSETLFFLALTFGLRTDPQNSLERTVGHVERLRRDAGIQRPFAFSAAASDGVRLFAVRFSSDRNSRSLYHSTHSHALKAVDGTYEKLPGDAIVIVSEPLDELKEHWAEIPESSFISVERGQVSVKPFTPRTP